MTRGAATTPEISVCIATFKRPELLRRTLDSVFAQRVEDSLTFEVCVADNDTASSAEPVVREFRAKGRSVAYAVEPTQNISLARNKSLSLARGRFIAILDDDVYPDGAWLGTLHAAALAFDADVVHGPVVSLFQPGTPTYVREYITFNRPNPVTGSIDGYTTTTANCLFRRELVEGQALPFDPAFGRSGGEDTEFFLQLRARRSRMIWCREALMFGPVLAGRSSLAWILRRQFRDGNTKHRYLPGSPTGSPGGSSASRGLWILLRIAMKLAAGAVHYVVGVFVPAQRERGRRALVAPLLTLAHRLGMLAHRLNIHYEEYRGTPIVT